MRSRANGHPRDPRPSSIPGKDKSPFHDASMRKPSHRLIRATTTSAALAGGYIIQHAAAAKWEPSSLSWSEAGLDLPSDLVSTTIGTEDGGTIHLLQRGEGRPVLFLHGVTLSAKVWAYQLQELASSYRVIAVDLRGHGLSKPGSSGTTIEQMADDLERVLDALDLTGAIVVGHSMGGMVAIEYALTHHPKMPNRVDGLLLVATSAKPLMPLNGNALPVKVATWLLNAYLAKRASNQQQPLPGGDIAAWLSRAAFGRYPLPAHVQVTQLMFQAMHPRSLSDILPSLAGFDRSNELREIELPTLVLVGTADLLTSPFHAKALASRIPRSSLKVLSGAGHMLMLEEPGELARAIREMDEETRPTSQSR